MSPEMIQLTKGSTRDYQRQTQLSNAIQPLSPYMLKKVTLQKGKHQNYRVPKNPPLINSPFINTKSGKKYDNNFLNSLTLTRHEFQIPAMKTAALITASTSLIVSPSI